MDIINPLEYPQWNELLLTSNDHSFFHTSSWARVLHDSYGYGPCYFARILDGKLTALLPMMEINSLLTGRRGVSLPFTDYCEQIADNESFGSLLDRIIEHGMNRGWRFIELRAGNALPDRYAPSSRYHGHVLSLTKTEEELFLNFRDANRRNIKKAIREGVEVAFINTPDSLKEFYRLNCMTRRDHGLPPQPYGFFKKIYEHVLLNDLGTIALASYKGKIVAGAVYFNFGDRVFYKYGASDKSYQYMRANNLVMWEAICRYRKRGCKKFDFGRTEPANKGLLQFKSGWGAQETTIYYYKYDLKLNTYIEEALKLKGMHNEIFRRMPIPLLKLAGSVLYRHVG